MRLLRALALTTLALFLSHGASGAEFPSRPIRIIVPYAPGGGSDVSARLISGPLGQNLGGTVIVENRAGSGGLAGTEYAAQAEPDGYTLVHAGIATLVFIPSGRQVQYNVSRDFIPLGLIWQSPLVLVANPKRGLKTMADFIAYAKANPGKLSFASAGVGTNTHMAIELFKRESTSFTFLIAAPALPCRICCRAKSTR